MRPFPDDPQWRQLSRKLPPDAVILVLLRLGFRPTDIADRFDCAPCQVSRIARAAGLPPVPNGSTRYKTNGAPLPRRVRLYTPIMVREGNRFVSRAA